MNKHKKYPTGKPRKRQATATAWWIEHCAKVRQRYLDRICYDFPY